MLIQIFYIILALFGISFLVFIHELGHYFMARKVGITVEAFSIGFGKPIVEWERKGVKWRICWLPFGGYVKMAGMEKQGPIEPYQIQDGFFGAKPWNRIKVALMGPLVNIVFAFVAFSLIWMSGGRNKPFSEFTSHIGWVDPDGELYKAEIRGGDEIAQLNGRPFHTFQDFFQSAALDNQALAMSGYEVDYWGGGKQVPFTYTFPHHENMDGVAKAVQVAGLLSPAQYLIFDQFLPGSPMEKSGILRGDRVVWVNGELVFSLKQLQEILNSHSILLTVQRAESVFLTRVPLLKISDLRFNGREREEMDDWSFEAKLDKRVEDLLFIPYNITAEARVENAVGYVDDRSESKPFFEPPERSPGAIPLVSGDIILAVQGKPISTGHELLKEMQSKTDWIVVKKETPAAPPSWKKADEDYVKSFEIEELKKITNSIGTENVITKAGDLRLLQPVKSIPMDQFPLRPAEKREHEGKIAKLKKGIENLSHSKQKEEAEKFVELYQTRQFLGVAFQDKMVSYNPLPYVLFSDVFKEIYRTLYALITGFLSPKYMSGPVGIVQIIHHGWSLGFNEALYWLGMISLNLGLLNLLPIPVLDGGHIVLSFWEMATKKPLKAKTMERLIIPFIILIVAFFIYATYNDIIRIIKSLF